MQRGFIEYSDQVALALEIVRREPRVAGEERARHRVVLLDEYQDTSVTQTWLLSELFHGHPVDGGRRPEPVDLRMARRVVEPTSRRTRASSARGRGSRCRRAGATARASSTQRTRSSRRSPLPTASRSPSCTPRRGASELPIDVVFAETIKEEADAVARWLKSTIAGRPVSAAMLMRARRTQSVFLAALREHDVKYHVLGLGGLLSEPEIADLVSALQVVHSAEAGHGAAPAAGRLALAARCEGPVRARRTVVPARQARHRPARAARRGARDHAQLARGGRARVARRCARFPRYREARSQRVGAVQPRRCRATARMPDGCSRACAHGPAWTCPTSSRSSCRNCSSTSRSRRTGTARSGPPRSRRSSTRSAATSRSTTSRVSVGSWPGSGRRRSGRTCHRGRRIRSRAPCRCSRSTVRRDSSGTSSRCRGSSRVSCRPHPRVSRAGCRSGSCRGSSAGMPLISRCSPGAAPPPARSTSMRRTCSGMPCAPTRATRSAGSHTSRSPARSTRCCSAARSGARRRSTACRART